MKLLTFLGLGNYTPTTYTWDGQEMETSFAPLASCRFLKADQIVVFLTQKARENVFNNFIKHAQESVQANVIPVDIPAGAKEEELWQIFSAILEQTSPDEELAFDVTHGFRSSPMISLLAAAFMRSAFNVKLKAILYGAYDAKDEANRTPIFDLSPMITLLEWAVAADRFNRTGDSRYFASLIREQQKSLALRGMLEEAGTLGKLQKNLTELSLYLHMIRPEQAMQAAEELKDHIECSTSALEKAMGTLPFRALLNTVKEAYHPVAHHAKPKDLAQLKEMLATERIMIGWYIERELWMQAAALIREWLVSWVMAQMGEVNISNRTNRERFESVISIEAHAFLNAKHQQPPFSSTFLSNLPEQEQFFGRWLSFTEPRNDLMHAGQRDDSKEPNTLISQIKETYNWLVTLPV
nr:TIGR02221 family CRISPR-associated protein [Anaerolinea thermophila]